MTGFDPRTAGWNMRLAPARLLRVGDVVTRTMADRVVATVDTNPSGTVATFEDGTSVTYTPRDTPMRWREAR